MTTAPVADQLRLLEVQALDTRAAQLAHRRRTLPALAELESVRADRAAAERDQVEARTRVRDVGREVAKAEADVEQVRSRAARDRERLDSGVGTPKDLQALAHELDSLARRQEVLEEVELEAMQRLEDAERELQEVVSRAADLDAREAAVRAQVEAALAVIDGDALAVASQRSSATQDLDPGLLALYERLRAHGGGIGAAPLRGGRCEGCRLELTTTDLDRIRGLAPDEVARCEECGRILVRVDPGRAAR